ncbi:TRAP transporter substrate-binding protein [Oscillibacter sp.]|uniref:TRAP transporter substrate-binding protein n=1 Tax=Oscillibacter sp. TaxID=1945593 RepID=UPI002D7E196A|nr:TRAP transporter substrate-binding protein [Oscillibacter sp.]
MNMKLLSGMLLLLVLLGMLTACGSTPPAETNAPGPAPEEKQERPESQAPEAPAKQVTWKMASNVIEGSDWAAAFEEMWARIEEETKGEVHVEMFYNGALGSEADVLQNLQTNNIQAAQISFSLLAQFEPEWNVMDMPFLFTSQEQLDKFNATEEAQELYARFQNYGIWFNYVGLLGFRYPDMVKAPIVTPDDLKGTTFRVMDNAIQMATLEAFGATPITVPVGDVYNALKMGVCDGWCGDAVAIQVRTAYEPAPYVSSVPLFPVTLGCLLSTEALDALTPESRETVIRIYSEMMPGVMSRAWDENLQIIKDLANEGKCEFVEVEDISAFQEKVTPVLDQARVDYGCGGWIDLISSL